MSALTVLKLWLAGAAFRVGGWSAPGRVLVGALDDPRDDVRTAAGYLLVAAGARAVPLLEARIVSRPERGEALAVLASVGDPDAEEALRRLAHGSGEEAADAAKALAARRRGQTEGGS